MHDRRNAGSLRRRAVRAAVALAAGLAIPLALGCLGLGLQLGPLGLHIGAGDSAEPPKPPPPRAKKETTAKEEPDGTLCQEGEVSVPAHSCTSVYYLRPFAGTPHLEVSEPDEDGVNFLITEQEPDHFTVKNKGLVFSRTFIWRARGANPSPRPVPASDPVPAVSHR
jgi:hypothetical protein